MSDWSDGFNLDDFGGGPPMPTFNLDDFGGGPPDPNYGLQPGWDQGPPSPYSIDPNGTGMGPPSPGGGGGLSSLSSLAKMFGLTNKDGSLNLGSLLPLLAGVGGSIYGISQNNKATNQVLGGINNANKIVTDTLGGNKALYQPYIDAGQSAMQKMQNAAPSNIAAQFGPLAGNYQALGSGRGLTLGKMSKGG